MDKWEVKWTEGASKLLLNRTIVKVRYMTDEEKEEVNWDSKPIVLILDNGTSIYPSRDSEGNDGGSLFTNHIDLPVIPVLK
tara:strand:- start:1522 stop:1764 length:243 start_codon:yes stop_codon:yes gene_type:complete